MARRQGIEEGTGDLNLRLSFSSRTTLVLDGKRITKNGDNSRCCSSNKEDILCRVCVCVLEYYSAIKKNEIMPLFLSKVTAYFITACKLRRQ